MPEVPGAALIQNPGGAFQGTDTTGTEIDQDTLLPQGVIPGVNVSGTPSAGQVLTATSPTAADWQTPSGGGGTGLGQLTGALWSGNWFGTGVGCENTTLTPPDATGVVQMMPFIVSQAASFTAIGTFVNTAGSSGSVVRLGIYKHDSVQGAPGDLLVDAGTHAAVTNNQWASAAISEALAPGLYWLAVAYQGSSGALPVLDAVKGQAVPGIASVPGPDAIGSSAGGVCIQASPVAGALPANITSLITSTSAEGPRIWLQQA